MTYLHQAEIQAVIRTKQSFRPAIPALQAVRVAPRQTSIFFSTCLCLLLIVPTLAEASSYRYKMNDGSVLFTDIRMSSKKAKSGQLDSLGQRANYQGSYGRPQATASCHKANTQTLAARYQVIEPIIEKAANTHQLDPMLLRAIARIESCYDPKALSSAGARGIMQLMPATAKGLAVSNSYDAAQNISGGARYFASLLKQFDQNTELALAAYNAGPGAVKKFGGIPPYPETRHYVPAVIKQYKRYRSGQI